MSKYYKYFNLVFKSELTLVGDTIDPCDFDIEVIVGEIPKYIKEDSKHRYNYILQDGNIYLDIRNVAYYYIEDGNKIIIEPKDEAKADRVIAYFYGPCLSMLTIRRGAIPLHGSAVTLDGKCYLLIGTSGAGKSTLAAGFVKVGAKVLSDDIILLRSSEHGYEVLPGIHNQKLWSDAINQLGIDATNLERMNFERDKYYVLDRNQFAFETMKVDAIISIEPKNVDVVSLELNNHKKALNSIIKYTFWKGLVNELYGDSALFLNRVNLVNALPIYELKRPKIGYTIEEQVNQIINVIHKGEANG